MRPNISITLTTPHVTIERYSELTGLSIDNEGCDGNYPACAGEGERTAAG